MVVIAAPDPPTAIAAKAATSTIPIVFGVGEDPVKLGLVSSLAAGRQRDRLQFFNVEVATKRLELLHELVPKAVRFAVLVNPANAAIAETTLRAVQDASRTIGLQIHVVNASTGREIDAAFATAARERLDALFVAGDVFFVSRRVQFSALATRGPVTARAMVRFPSRIKVSGPPEEKGAAPLRYNETGIVVQSTLVGSASHLWVGGINT